MTDFRARQSRIERKKNHDKTESSSPEKRLRKRAMTDDIDAVVPPELICSNQFSHSSGKDIVQSSVALRTTSTSTSSSAIPTGDPWLQMLRHTGNSGSGSVVYVQDEDPGPVDSPVEKHVQEAADPPVVLRSPVPVNVRVPKEKSGGALQRFMSEITLNGLQNHASEPRPNDIVLAPQSSSIRKVIPEENRSSRPPVPAVLGDLYPDYDGSRDIGDLVHENERRRKRGTLSLRPWMPRRKTEPRKRMAKRPQRKPFRMLKSFTFGRIFSSQAVADGTYVATA
eukprot:scaffold6708_cov134-Cylindrotheca_fusiformis.AAC.14